MVFIYLCLIVGLFKVIGYLQSIVQLINQHLLSRYNADHYSKYGIVKDNKNISWIVITGGSDGIGLAFCHHLAK